MENVNTVFKNKKTRSLFIIWALTTGTCLFLFWDFLFNGQFPVFKDIGSDTIQQYIMQYATIIHHIQEGNFTFWDFDNGFGMNMMGLNIFNPFLMIIYALGTLLGPSRIPGMLIYLIILEIFLAGTVMYFYLSEFNISDTGFTESAKCIASYIYAFNGYMLVWGQHYQFGAYVIFLPLLLLFIERMIKAKKFHFLLPVLVAVMSMCSVYMTYMALLFTGIYLVFRTAMLKRSEPYARILLFSKCCGGILLGIGMGMAVFLPGVYYLLNISSRLDSDISIFTAFLSYFRPYPKKFYITSIYRLFATNYQGTASMYVGGANYYEAPVYFVTLLGFILLVQFLFTIHRQKTEAKNKVLLYLTVPVFLFFFFVPAGACMFNAFAYPMSRHTFTLMPVLTLMIAYMLDQIFVKKQLSYIGLLLTVPVLAAVHFRAQQIVYIENLKKTIIFCGILGILMVLLLFAAGIKKINVTKSVTVPLLFICLIGNICAEGYWDYNERENLSKEDTLYFERLYGEPINQVLSYLAETDPSFYRIEKDYEAGSYCMDALAQNYNGVSAYNGTQNKYIQQFVSNLWPNLIRMVKTQYSFRQAPHDMGMASLTGIKYIISLRPDLKDTGLTLLKQFDYLYLYRNENTDSIAKFYADTVSESDFEQCKEDLDKEDFLSNVLILPTISNSDILIADAAKNLKEIPMKVEDMEYTDSSEIRIPLDSSLLKNYQKIYAEFDITPDIAACYYFFTDNTEMSVYHTNLTPGSQHIKIALPSGSETLRIGAYGNVHGGKIQNFRFTGSKEAAHFSSKEEITICRPSKDSRIEASVNAPSDGYLFLAVPYEDGWTAAVDGKEAKILRADYGFSAVAVKKGAHEVVLEFNCPWLIPGCVLMAMSWGFYLFLYKKRKK